MATGMTSSAVQCPICVKPYSNPRTLPNCLHSFCEICLRSLTSKHFEELHDDNEFECPVCNTTFHGPQKIGDIAEWSQSLPPNNLLIRSSEKECQNFSNCEPCAFRGVKCDAALFCTVCKEAQCSRCADVHRSSRGTRAHQLTEICDALHSDVAVNIDNLMACVSHKNKTVAFHCVDHDAFVCSTCAVREHRECSELIDLSTVCGEVLKQKLALEIKANLTQTISYIDNVCTTAKREVDKHVTEITEFKTEIEEAKKVVIRKFDAFENHLSAMLPRSKEIVDAKQKILTDEKYKLCSAIDSSLTIFDAILDQGLPSQAYFYGKHLEKNMASYERKLQTILHQHTGFNIDKSMSNEIMTLTGENGKIATIHLHSREIDFPKLNLKEQDNKDKLYAYTNTNAQYTEYEDLIAASYGTADKGDTEQLRACDPHPCNTLEGMPSISAEYSSDRPSQSSGTKVDIKKIDVYTFKKPIEYFSGATFIDDRRAVLVDPINFNVILLDLETALIKSQIKLRERPADVITLAKTQIAVNLKENQNILIIKVSNDTLKPIRSIKTECMLQNITKWKDGQLFVSCSTNKRDSTGGTYFMILGLKDGKELKEKQLFNVRDGKHFAIDQSNGDETRVLCSCDITNELVCFGANWKKQFAYKILGPAGVDVDALGNAYVASLMKHEIHVVSRDGHCLNIAAYDGLHSPYKLQMNGTRNKFM